MTNRVPCSFQLRIRTTENDSVLIGQLNSMPIDGSVEMKMKCYIYREEGEPDLKTIYVVVEFTAYWEDDYESKTYDWAVALIKSKQNTITKNGNHYALLEYDMDCDASRYGSDTYTVKMKADYHDPLVTLGLYS